MTKQEYLTRLREALAGLPPEDLSERLGFYREMIEDRMEDGLREAEAVAELGPPERAAAEILGETPLTRLVRERVRRRGLRKGETLLLILGSPVWAPLLLAAAAVAVSLYGAVWALVLSLWAVDLAFALGGLGGAAMGILRLCRGETAPGLAALGAGLALAGLSVLLFFACRAVTAWVIRGTGKLVAGLKARFVRREGAE